jgi:Lectin C-type domain
MWAYSHELLTESFWGDNRPNNRTGTSDNCVVMILRGNAIWWEDRSCLVHDISQHAVAPICQHDSTEASTMQTPTTTETTNATAFQCPSGWKEFEGHCYSPQEGAARWTDAENECRKLGAHLISIHSEAEDDFVRSLSTTNNWIGANYRSGAWQWSDGSGWNYSNWFDNSDPDIYACATSNQLLGWISVSCDGYTYYMCKL